MDRILIVENSLDVTGAFNSIVRSSLEMRQQFEFIFLIPKGSRCKKNLEENGFITHELPMLELRKDLVTLLLYLPVLLINAIRLKRLLKLHRIDLMVNNDFYNLLPAMVRFFGCPVPYVCYVRFMPDRFPRLLVKFWCAVHDLYSISWIVVSQAVKQKLFAANKIEVIPNEYPIESPSSHNENSRILLYPANYTQGKGQDFAIKSFAKIAHLYPEWRLKFVGGDLGLKKNQAYKKTLIDHAHALKLSSQIVFSGFSETMRNEYFNAAIVLVFSESESFSMVCVEAMHSECPVIATRCGGPEEIIDHGETGILVPIGDIDQMAESMKVLIENPVMRKQLGINGSRSVLQKFGREKTVEKLGQLYAWALKVGQKNN